jgi:TolA-binding protein
MATGNDTDAIQAFQPLIAQGRHGQWSEAALYWTGEALLRSGDLVGAAQHLQQLVDSYPTGEYLEPALYSLGYARQKTNAHSAGLHAFQLLLERFPQSQWRGEAELGVARALVSLQRFAEAAPYWEHLGKTASSPDQAEEATFWWGESWTRADRCDRARRAFQDYLQRFPQGSHRVAVLDAAAICAHHAGDLAAEIASLEALLQQLTADPQREPILLRLADAYEQTGELARAQALYSQWLSTFPDSPSRTEVLIRRGSLSHRQERYRQAVQDFTEVLHRASDPHQRYLAHAMLAEGYVRHDD